MKKQIRIILAFIIMVIAWTTCISQNTFKNEDLQKVNASILKLDTTCGTSGSTGVLNSILVQEAAINQKNTKLDSLEIKIASVSSVSTDKALVVDQRPTTATFGSTIPTVTAYNSSANTITTTNCITIVIENVSVTKDATIVYGGITFNLGYVGNTARYPTTYTFTMPFDWPSKKYSPFPTLVVNAASSQVAVTKYFIQ